MLNYKNTYHLVPAIRLPLAAQIIVSLPQLSKPSNHIVFDFLTVFHLSQNVDNFAAKKFGDAFADPRALDLERHAELVDGLLDLLLGLARLYVVLQQSGA